MAVPPPPPPPAATQAANKRVTVWQADVPAAYRGQRVADVLQQLAPERFATITSAKTAVRRHTILVDGCPAQSPAQILEGGELLECQQRQGAAVQAWAGDRAAAAAAPGAGGHRLEVLFEDDHLACVVKPQGIPCDTPPGRGSAPSSAAGSASASAADVGEAGAPPAPQVPSVFTLLALTLAPSPLVGAINRPRHVHRLDLPTGGLLLAAKTHVAQAALCAAFEQRRVAKRYRALVWGRLEGHGLVTYCLSGRRCETEYAAVQHSAVDLAPLGIVGSPEAAAAAAADGGAAVWVTTVDLWPHTGRKHQLRRHMALLGHPLVGEPRYSFGYAQERLRSGQAMPPEAHVRLADAAGPAAAVAAASAAAGGEGAAVDEAGAAAEGMEVPATAAAAAAAAAVAAGAAGAAEVAQLSPAESLLRFAAATASQRHDLLLHLWAVELRLESHPASGQPLHFALPGEPPAFAATRVLLGGPAAIP